MAPTRNTSHPPESNSPHIPRPPNCFILYRSEKLAQLRREASEIPGCSFKDTRALISKMWQEESEEVLEYWRQKAERKAAEHRLTYPGYKYQPKKKIRPNAAIQKLPAKTVEKSAEVPLLPVPALVPSSIPYEGYEVASSPAESSSAIYLSPVQSCTIISPSFTRPSPNFSFLSLNDPSEADSTYSSPMLENAPQVLLPEVPPIQPQPSSIYTPLPEPLVGMSIPQLFSTGIAPFSSEPVMVQPHYTAMHSANGQYTHSFATSVPNNADAEFATPTIVPSQAASPWAPDNRVYTVEAGPSVEAPAISAFGHVGVDNCLRDMVSNLLFLPENMFSGFYF